MSSRTLVFQFSVFVILAIWSPFNSGAMFACIGLTGGTVFAHARIIRRLEVRIATLESGFSQRTAGISDSALLVA